MKQASKVLKIKLLKMSGQTKCEILGMILVPVCGLYLIFNVIVLCCQCLLYLLKKCKKKSECERDLEEG